MTKIKFEDGRIVSFDGNPTPQDIEAVAKQLKISPSKPKGFLGRAGDALKERGGEFVNTFKETAKGDITPVETGIRTVGDAIGGVGDVIGAAISPQVEKLAQKEWAKPIFESLAGGMEKYEGWKNSSELNRRTAEVLESVVNIADLAGATGATKSVGKGVINTARRTADNITDSASNLKNNILNSPRTQAITQTGQDLVERVPRAIERVKEGMTERATRFNTIRQSTPEVASAIKSNLDDRIIQTVTEADDVTKKAFKSVVDIAEDSTKSSSLKKQPSIVSGELVTKQFDLINKKRKEVGEQIGNKVKELSRTEKMDIVDGLGQLENVLSNQGIKVTYTSKGAVLDFKGSNFTPAERIKIQELYNLATEGGDKLTPLQIRDKDKLFSKLQRESAMEGVGKIIVDTPEGSQSLFSTFRDTFSSKLDEVSPEIKKLNKEYRDLLLIIEDIEDSILKTPNFNITKTADSSEFAKVNLRRIFGEAQSSPAFEAVADKMDELARSLGYTDATPKQVAEFAQVLRKLYPESIPKTGFSGGISTGIMGTLGNALDATLKAGKPNLLDQRKALLNLLK